jgi:hypothetical protein
MGAVLSSQVTFLSASGAVRPLRHISIALIIFVCDSLSVYAEASHWSGHWRVQTVEASRTLGRGGMRGVQQPAVEVLIRREAMLQRLPLAPNDAVDIPISIQIGESISSGHTECRVCPPHPAPPPLVPICRLTFLPTCRMLCHRRHSSWSM